MSVRRLSFEATRSSGQVSALLQAPDPARLLYVFAHGAGAGMEHPFMADMATVLEERGVATFRFNFPYIEAGRRAPNPHPILKKTIRSAVETARDLRPGLPVVAGGKSMGGRLTSVAQAEDPIPGVDGLAFLGFPLHAPGKPSDHRAEHLPSLTVPLLFLQGTRDRLAKPELLRPVVGGLGARATLVEIEGGDHSFKVPKASGLSAADVYDRLAEAFVDWAAGTRIAPS